ncbi:hypothetical protein niasHT_034576 [Heterodera trifolii]|uniref:Tyrosine--tRNA ligase n=1 Tax=Heterodera trifolii TaxID=157864 RepID=A0ABD2IUY4_9BILA
MRGKPNSSKPNSSMHKKCHNADCTVQENHGADRTMQKSQNDGPHRTVDELGFTTAEVIGLHSSRISIQTTGYFCIFFDIAKRALRGSNGFRRRSERAQKRKLLLRESINENSKALQRQVEQIKANVSSLYGEDISLEIRNNAEWYKEMRILDFFKSTKRFRISDMLKSGPIKSRLDDCETLSYAEFSYQTLQAIDWLKLYEKTGCLCQIGGTDQFGNLKAGFEHIRANTERLSIALCMPLLTDKYGRKLGKSSDQNGSTAPLWLDQSKTSAFAFYQHLRQLHDDAAEHFLVNFSLRKTTEVEDVLEEHRNNLGKWVAQIHLAEEMTAIVHGKAALERAKKCSKILFDGGSSSELENLNPDEITEMFGSASTFEIVRGSIKTMGDLAAMTKQDGINLMRAGALKINGTKVIDPEEKIDLERILINGRFTIVCWGRRKFSLIKWS